jgi:putative membrane protein
MKNNPLIRIGLFFKGIGMGAADVVPGVSGGTIAFITNIYEELINSLKSVDTNALKLLIKFRLKDFWKHINGNFLLTVLSGIIVSILSLARLLHYLLEEHPNQIWSFFFGLVLISAIWVMGRVKVWKAISVVFAIIGTGIAYYITIAAPATTPETWPFVFLAGAIAICAMILPGVSGSYILLILGKYEFILGAIKDFEIGIIIVFIVGCVVGLLSFVRVVAWFLERFHDATITLLAGFMLGSLNKIWPWKETLTYRENSDGEMVPLLQSNLLPTEYMNKMGDDPQLFSAIIFFAAGILIVVLLEIIAKKLKKSN